MKPLNWLLIAAVVVLAWLALRDKEPEPGRVALNYDQVVVSEGLTAEAEALDLSGDLDVSLLPDIGRQVIREAAQQGLREQAFLQFVLREVSNRVREISTIDLNADGITDPVLVKPEPQEGEQFVLLSVHVPAPAAYPLPEARDADAWKSVETLEVATMTVALDPQALTVEAQGNQHLYPNAAQQNYVVHDTMPSFLSMYFTMRMLDWMFFPPMWGFWGPGWGYGAYQPRPVPGALGGRAETIAGRNYQPSTVQRGSAIQTRSGAAPRSQYSRLYANQRPQALNQLRSSTAFRPRGSAAAPPAGGFGQAQSRSPGAFSNRSAVGSRSLTAPRPFRPRIGGGFGGFGRGGFRFRRCHGCWRGPVEAQLVAPGVAGSVVVLWPAVAPDWAR